MTTSHGHQTTEEQTETLLTAAEQINLALKIELAQGLYDIENQVGNDLLLQSFFAVYRLGKARNTWFALARHLEYPRDLELRAILATTEIRNTLMGKPSPELIADMVEDLNISPKAVAERLQELAVYLRLAPIYHLPDHPHYGAISMVNISDLRRRPEWVRSLARANRPVHALFHSIAVEGERAIEEMCIRNRRLMRSIVNTHPLLYAYPHLNKKEAEQSGYMGLLEATHRYNFRIARFSTYATPWIRRFVDHGLKDQLNIIHLPDETLAQIQKIHSATETLSQSLARTPNVNEISEATGMRRSRVITLVQHNNDVEYLDLHKHDYHKDWATGKTSETPQEWSEQKAVMDIVANAMMALPMLQRRIIVHNWGIYDNPELSETEMAELYGLSPKQVRIMHDQGIKRLRELLGDNPLPIL